MTKRIVSILLAIVMIASLTVTFVSAATDADLDTARKVSVTLNCNKTGYVFELYRIADLVKTTNPYSVKYDVKVTNTAVRTAVANGNFAEADRSKILDALDKDSALSGATAIGAYEVAEDGNTKTFGNLAQGIYYVRAINFPAGVKSVTNSCFALPYCNENGWIYSIDAINLAAKVAEDEPEIIKEITNSTKGDVNFTDVSIGDTVEFEITTSVLGAVNEVPEHDFKLNSYIISDVMSKGLTLNQNSFTVSLTDDDYNVISAIAPENYTVSVTAADGEDTTFTVSLKKAYLQTAAAFYSAAYVVTDFSAVLNKYATTEVVGNPNEAVKLTYSNKNDVQGEVEGNKVFVYTYKLEVHKFDDVGAKLQGAEFALYKTEADAKEERNAIATGVSDANGLVEFKNSREEVMRLASGKYFVRESKAPNGYNRYTDVIPVEIKATYTHTFTNGTYIENAPEHGTASFDVKNSKTVLPQTGGQGNIIAYSIAFILAAAGGVIFFVARKKKRNNADKAA